MTKTTFGTLSAFVEAGHMDIQTGPFGTQLKASDYVSDGIPVINVRNIGHRSEKDSDLEYLDERMGDKLSQHKLQPRDIVFGRKGAVDRHLYVQPKHAGWIQGSDCIRIRFFNGDLDSNFLSYFFLTEGHKKWIEAQGAFGATMGSLNQGIIGRIMYPVFPLPIQHKIAAILTAYDDLIENNNRRIALLEKMAEEIYREWFVRLRFPGHKSTKIVKGVPEGWEVVNALQVLAVLGGGTPATDEPAYWDGEIPFFTPKDSHEGYFANMTEKTVTPLGVENCNSPIYPKGTIFITARGTVGNIVMALRPMAMNQSCYALKPISGMNNYFYFLAMRNAVSIIKGTANSGVFDNIITDSFKQIPLIKPREETVQEFEKTISPMIDLMETLVQATDNLVNTRDRLLSRLMSGKIDVEKLDIQFPESMANADSPADREQ